MIQLRGDGREGRGRGGRRGRGDRDPAEQRRAHHPPPSRGMIINNATQQRPSFISSFRTSTFNRLLN